MRSRLGLGLDARPNPPRGVWSLRESAHRKLGSAWPQGEGPPPDPYAELIKSEGPIGYWRFGERSGTDFIDAMGNYSGTYLNSPSLGEPGVLTEPQDFVDTAALIMQDQQALSSGDLFTTAPSAYSIEFWIKPVEFANYNLGVYAQSGAWGGSWVFHSSVDGGVYCGTDYNGSDRFELPAGTMVSGTWYHWVYTRLGSGAAQIFKNGTLVGTGQHDATAAFNGIRIFQSGNVGGGYYDELAVYDYILSANSVEEHWLQAGVS